MHRFGDDGFANEQWRVQLLDASSHPVVIFLRSIKKGDERPGVNDGGGHLDRNLRGVWDLRRDPESLNERCHGLSSLIPQGFGSWRAASGLRGLGADPPRSNLSVCARATPPRPWPGGKDHRTLRWLSSSAALRPGTHKPIF